MKNTHNKSEILRQKAEELLKLKPSGLGSPISETDMLKLIHELEVHQIELEMQNVELIKAKKQAAVAAEKYTELYDFAPTGYFTLSKEGEIFELNLFGSKMLGKERQFLKNSQFGFFVSEDTKPIFNLFLGNLFDSKVKEECEIALSTSGNLPMFVHLSGFSHDNREQCFVTMVDITERKQAEETLRESELKFRTVADNTCDWEYLQDENQRIIYMSPSCIRITGYTPNEFISNPELLQKIVNPEDVDLFVSHFDNIFSFDHRNDIGELDFRIQKKDGAIVNIHHICGTLYDNNNKYIGRRVSNRDTTERKKAQDALLKSEALYRNLLERLPDGVYKSTHEGRFVDVNPAMVNMLGYESKEDLLSIDIKTQLYFEPTDRESLVLQEKLEEMGVYRLKKKDGSEIWVEDHGWYDLDENGNIIYHEGIMRDITDRKKAELEIKLKNEELQKANAEKDKFFSIIAHDLRSPFHVFLGYTRIMVDDLDTMTLEEIRKIVVNMQKSATNMYGLLENLLEWSMMQRMVIAYTPKSIPLALKIKGSIEFITGSMQKKEIEIIYDIPEGLSVFADVQMVESMIRNLISNAVKFTPKGGRITVLAKKIKGNFIEVAIRDTGFGMNKELIGKLFKLDEQTGRKGTEGEPSTGLGLIICKDFVEKHGCKIWAESEEGKGSTFCFTLPAAPPRNR
jgi:PAS domain S-box-containing protein